MKTSSAKAKGRRCAKEVKSLILKLFINELAEDDITVASSGQTGEDILLSPKARELFPFSIECKNTERLNLWDALLQAESNCGEYTPLLCFRKNRSKLYTVITTKAFMEMAYKAAMFDSFISKSSKEFQK